MAATKKASSSTRTKKTAAKAASTSTTRVSRVSSKSVPSRNTAGGVGTTSALKLDSSTLNIVIAEVVGTFVLTLVALLSMQDIMPLYVGLTLALLVFSVGSVSGAHVNPAVTFGLWSVKKLKAALIPFYWCAQLLGAMAAFVTVNVLSGNAFGVDFSHFGNLNWNIFTVELVGTAVFLFGLVATLSRVDLSAAGKAIGVGMSLMVGVLVASSIFTSVSAGVDQSQIKVNRDEKTGTQTLENVPHELRVAGATLNPAVALASTERTDTQLQSSQAAKDEKKFSRFGLEVILSTLIGAALGANLARLINHRFDN